MKEMYPVVNMGFIPITKDVFVQQWVFNGSHINEYYGRKLHVPLSIF